MINIKTQQQLAKELGVSQTTIHLTIKKIQKDVA